MAQYNNIDCGCLFKPGYKIWLEKDDGVQGDGFFQLLEQIEKNGTIAAAAESMGMSYRAAWGKIKKTEKQWGISLVTTKVGGDTGGGASLTPQALNLLQRFFRFRQDVDQEIAKIFKRDFID
ncbi:MAG: LysR family transcriptional regulator [Desulfotomaculaceae bacterium]